QWQQLQARQRGENPAQDQIMREQVKTAQQARFTAAMQAKYRKVLDEKMARGEKVAPMEAFRAGITPAEFKMLSPSSGVQSPSAVREFEYFKNLDEAGQQQFLAVKRAQQIKDFGGYHGAVSPDGSVTNVGDKTLAPSQETDYIADAAAAQETGRATGELQAGANEDIAKADQFIGLIDKAIGHPGRESATGMSSVFNSVAMPGGDRKDFLVLGQQLRGKNFLEAYQGLKGGGQITEVEGLKAENAQARLNEAQSEEEYLTALNDMKMLIAERVQRIKGKLGIADSGWSIVED
ncbi:hypothetical protein N9J84_05320, partial [Porticoccaceae bacterium]|nr:hypothetical protein [Porticoccaceae bacterium]